MKKKRVMIVDDHPLVLDGLKRLIETEPDLEVCAEAVDAEQALSTIAIVRPDVLLTDLSMKGMGGLNLVREASSRFPDIPVLVVSFHSEKAMIERSLRAGASGYVAKDEASEIVAKALREVLDGGRYFSRSVEDVASRSPDPAEPGSCAAASGLLSDRELEVLQLLSEGMRTRDIADNLFISRKTVEAHYENMKRKLRISSIRELVTYAARRYGPECLE